MNGKKLAAGWTIALMAHFGAGAATAGSPDGEIATQQIALGEQLSVEELNGQLHDIGVALPPELEELHRRNLESQSLNGYIDEAETDPRARYVQKRMEERRAAARAAGVDMTPRRLGFYEMNNLTEETSELPFMPSAMPVAYLSAESKSYILLSGDKIKQLHTDTKFGTLIIDELTNVSTQLFAPNIEIEGVAASLVYKRHRAEQWATVVYAPWGDKLWIIEADKRLVGNAREEFVQLVEDLVR